MTGVLIRRDRGYTQGECHVTTEEGLREMGLPAETQQGLQGTRARKLGRMHEPDSPLKLQKEPSLLMISDLSRPAPNL